MDPAAFFSEIDALVVPSIWEEPLGRVVHEAFAFGKPVLASRMGGIPEIVQDGVNGILVEASSSTALATAMRAACDNPASLARMGRAALECSPAFERSAILDQYQAILEAAIHAHQAPVRS
jgi:glycosyltransferase involved in cell wall biosynthesis